jgi:hypothetical protein
MFKPTESSRRGIERITKKIDGHKAAIHKMKSDMLDILTEDDDKFDNAMELVRNLESKVESLEMEREMVFDMLQMELE